MVDVFQQARRQGAKRLLGAWVRGMGDVATRLCGFVAHVRSTLPGVSVSFITRPGLREVLLLIPDVEEILVVPEWRREDSLDGRPTLEDVRHALARLGREGEFDLLIPQLDRGPWWHEQVGSFVPRLRWGPERAAQARSLMDETRFASNALRLAVHLEAGTKHFYGGEGVNRDWPPEHWRALFARLAAEARFAVFVLGDAGSPTYEVPFGPAHGFCDFRGRTSVIEALSVIGACDIFLAPDSGLLNLVYYLDMATPLQVVSLHAAISGVLRQGVSSPNPRLVHTPLVEPSGQIEAIPVERVFDALLSARERALGARAC